MHLWKKPTTTVRADVPRSLESHNYVLTRATDVNEVIAWAAAEVNHDETYVVYLAHHDGGALGQVRLLGTDPTAP